MPLTSEDYVFFWKTNEEEAGWASQWHISPFTASIASAVEGAPAEPHTFPTAEHWMMACKAALFGDTKILNRILKTGGTDPKVIKLLGRKIHLFDEDTWIAAREKIVYQGNWHKFTQDEDLRKALLATGQKILVEASPFDSIWGIGFTRSKAMANRHKWGLSLLGNAIMDVRRDLNREGEGEVEDSIEIEGGAPSS